MSDGLRSSGPVYVVQSYFVPATKNDAEHYQIHVRPSFEALTLDTVRPCLKGRCTCRVYVTFEADVFYEAIGYEGVERRCVLAWQPGKRGDGSTCSIVTAITRDTSSVAA